MSDIFISHSSDAGPQVSAFLAALPDALRGRKLQPFLDTEGLRAGYEWRPVLYRKLAECEGAVLALGPGALERPWIRQEATILAWRRSLRGYQGRSMPVVAVLLDGLTRKQLVDGLPALNLGETEIFRLRSDTAAAAAAAATDVAQIFPEGVTSSDDPLQRWTGEVGSWLRGVNDYFLDELDRMFNIAQEDWDPRSRCRTLADALLHADNFVEVEKALYQIANSGAVTADRVVNAVLPVAISAASAQVLLTALQEASEQRLVALNTFSPVLGELFVQRATCCDIGVLVVRTPHQITGDENALYAEIVAAIGWVAGARPPKSFKPEDLCHLNQRLVVLLQQVNTDRQGIPLSLLVPILDRLRRDFPTCVFLLLSGAGYDTLDHLVPSPLQVDPPLSEDVQLGWELAANRLRDFGREMSR